MKASEQHNNAGFSLVELIVVVAILAIAAIPLMRSIGMASKANARAQSIQNATSLAEHVMEEIKGSDINALVAANGGFTDGECTYTHPMSSVTQGENFIATVTISKKEYSGNTTPAADKRDNVKSANTLELPKIDEIDSLSQAVLSSEREFNRYDTAAQSYFNERKPDYNPLDDAGTKATIDSKKVDIIKSSFTEGGHNAVKVKATVTYTSSGREFVRELYTGSFVQASGDFIDSNIYIFYKKGSMADAIVIKDLSSYTKPGEPELSHKVYFIRQDDTDTVGPTIKLLKTVSPEAFYTFNYPATPPIGTPPPTPVDGDFRNGRGKYGKVYLITNIGTTGSSDDGHIYGREARISVYDITVVLTKSDDTREYARLHSTATASD